MHGIAGPENVSTNPFLDAVVVSKAYTSSYNSGRKADLTHGISPTQAVTDKSGEEIENSTSIIDTNRSGGLHGLD